MFLKNCAKPIFLMRKKMAPIQFSKRVFTLQGMMPKWLCYTIASMNACRMTYQQVFSFLTLANPANMATSAGAAPFRGERSQSFICSLSILTPGGGELVALWLLLL